MDITIVTTAQDNETGKALLDAYGFPFKKGADADNEPRKKKKRGPQYGGKRKK
jgi:large subunit ribosomal protein L5